MIKLVRALHFQAPIILATLFAACSGNDEPAGNEQDTGEAGADSTPSGGSASAGQPSSAGGGATNGAAAGSDAGSIEQGGGDSAGAGGRGAAALSPVALGSAENYVILAKSAISNVPTSRVTGSLGLSPAAASYITGFSLTKAGTRWSSVQVVGDVFAADNDAPTPSDLTTAVADMQTAYTDAAGRARPDFLNLEGGIIGGLTLKPGLYKWTSTVTIPTDVTLDGGPEDVWILQVTGDLKLAAAQAMTLTGGARPAHIFWQVAGAVELGATSKAEGIVLSKTAIDLQTGATVNGRLFAQTAVSLAGASVSEP